jgi:hypothetical protein
MEETSFEVFLARDIHQIPKDLDQFPLRVESTHPVEMDMDHRTVTPDEFHLDMLQFLFISQIMQQPETEIGFLKETAYIQPDDLFNRSFRDNLFPPGNSL